MKILLSIIALALLGSCVTYTRCVDKFGQYGTDTVRIPYEVKVPYEVIVPADSAQMAIALDSLLKLRVDSVFTYKSDSSDLTIQFWIDKFKRLQIKANQPAKIIHDTLLVKGDVIHIPTKLVDKPNKWQLFWNEYKFYSAIILPLLLLLAWFLKK